ncbi:MAG: GNAT family N-acetyltransferase [Chloroflexota bacterium]|nr:MAG: GNAT family N-acetyltransferase [Chloroflexota bacterium]
MDGGYNIVYQDEPEWGIIGGGISSYNKEQAGDDSSEMLCFVLKDPDQQVVGGLIGSTHYEWLQVDLMWVKEDLRGRGFGRRLLQFAEDEARRRGAKNAYLDTFSFQAPDFYKKHGYQVFGELRDFPPGHQRYYLTKQL